MALTTVLRTNVLHCDRRTIFNELMKQQILHRTRSSVDADEPARRV